MEDCPLCNQSCPVRVWIENLPTVTGFPHRTVHNIFICHDCMVQWEPARDRIWAYGSSPLKPTHAEIRNGLPIDSPLVVY